LRIYIPSTLKVIKNTNVPEEAKDFIKNILVLDPKMRMTTKEMLAHPFINNEDLIKSLPVEA
jgi:serine/threonine protein kinase